MPLKRGGLQSRARIAGGKSDAKCRSESGRAADADVTRMLLNYAIGHGEAEARATSDALGGEERIVNFGDIVRIDSDAVVGYLDRKQIFFAISRRKHNSPLTIGNRITRIK